MMLPHLTPFSGLFMYLLLPMFYEGRHFSAFFRHFPTIVRPILVYASDRDIEDYGEHEEGCAGLFLPTRHGPSGCKVSRIGVHRCSFRLFSKGKPLAISWSSAKKNHFVPLIAVAGSPQNCLGCVCSHLQVSRANGHSLRLLLHLPWEKTIQLNRTATMASLNLLKYVHWNYNILWISLSQIGSRVSRYQRTPQANPRKRRKQRGTVLFISVLWNVVGGGSRYDILTTRLSNKW